MTPQCTKDVVIDEVRDDPREIDVSSSSCQQGQPSQLEQAQLTESSSWDAGTHLATTMVGVAAAHTGAGAGWS